MSHEPPRPPSPREQEVFFAALERPDPAERTAFLEAECRNEPEVRRWVEAGERIGVYKLLSPLGEGGFGVVWLAEQELPVRRRVALKIIRLGMNSQEIIARFAQERQALALMDHPGIAKVFDAKRDAAPPTAPPGGRPYFGMESCPGVPSPP